MSCRRVLLLPIIMCLLTLLLGCGQSPNHGVSSNEETNQSSDNTSSTDNSYSDGADEANNEDTSLDDKATNEPADDPVQDTNGTSDDTTTTTPPVNTTSTNPEPWGHLRGQFVFDGTPAEMITITPQKTSNSAANMTYRTNRSL